MKYMLLIHQGSAPTPRSPEDWEKLSAEEQQAIYTEYRAVNETPGVTPGLALDEPSAGTTVRLSEGEVLRTDGPFAETKEAIAGYLVFEGDSIEAADRACREDPRCPAGRLDRSEAGSGVVKGAHGREVASRPCTRLHAKWGQAERKG